MAPAPPGEDEVGDAAVGVDFPVHFEEDVPEAEGGPDPQAPDEDLAFGPRDEQLDDPM